MFKKNTVSGGEIFVSSTQELAGIPTMLKALVMLKTMAEETGIIPQPYQNTKRTNLRVQFCNSCIDISDFLDVYGSIIGDISEEYPIVINGLIDQMEEGTLTVKKAEGGYLFALQSSSGGDFDTLSHIYLKIQFSDSDQCDFADSAIENFHLGRDFVAMSRKWDDCDFTKGLFESTDVLYFRYVPVGLEPTDVYDEMAELLSVEQATELWARFLQGGASWAEFETVQALITHGSYDGLYKWELALKLAVECVGMTVDFSGGGVNVTRENGERLKLGYNNSTGAEKLFAKIIFPA